MRHRIDGKLPDGVKPVAAAEYEGLLIIATTDGIYVCDTTGLRRLELADAVPITAGGLN